MFSPCYCLAHFLINTNITLPNAKRHKKKPLISKKPKRSTCGISVKINTFWIVAAYTQHAARFHSIDRYKGTGVNKTATPNKFFIVAGRTIKRSGRFDERTPDDRCWTGCRKALTRILWNMRHIHKEPLRMCLIQILSSHNSYAVLYRINKLRFVRFDPDWTHNVRQSQKWGPYLIYLLQTCQLEPYQFS